MSELLPPNASAAERAIARTIIGPIDAIPAPQRVLWNPDTCPEALLPWLAWALSVDTWKSWWPVHIKRAILRSAIAIQRRKGTAHSVREVIEAFGGTVQLKEWFEMDPPGAPHTFQMVLGLSGAVGSASTPEFVDDVIAEVRRIKPVRSHFTFTQAVTSRTAIGVVAGARVVAYRRLRLQALAA